MDEKLEALLPLYALDALTPDERAQVDAYLAANPDARTRLAELSQAAAALPYAAPPVTPPPALKQKLMARVAADARRRLPAPERKPSPWETWQRRLTPLALTASLGLAALALAWGASLNAQVAQLRAEAEQLRQQVTVQDRLLTQLTAPGARITEVSGTDLQPGARGHFIADPRRATAVLVVSGLVQLQPDQTYQFWLLREGVAVGAGTFTVDESGRAVLTVDSGVTDEFTAVGVSIEPAGGSPAPSERIVMLGELS
jgi:anti-sigma-K factor RskA